MSLINYSEKKQAKLANIEQAEKAEKGTTIHGLTEQELKLLIAACKIAARMHDKLTQDYNHLMGKGELLIHLNRASEFTDLCKKLQDI